MYLPFKTLLKNRTADELTGIIKKYVDGCISSKTWIKNFSTFLNNIPDYSEPETPEPVNEYDELRSKYAKLFNGEILSDRSIEVIHPKYVSMKENHGINLEDYIIKSLDVHTYNVDALLNAIQLNALEKR